MSRKEENAAFTCAHCFKNIVPLDNGSYRNHCPFCLASMHIDVKPGDRKQSCKGLMFAIGLVYKKKKGWQIIHRCRTCRHQSVNKIAENCVQPDEINALIELNKVIDTSQ